MTGPEKISSLLRRTRSTAPTVKAQITGVASFSIREVKIAAATKDVNLVILKLFRRCLRSQKKQ